MYASLASPRPAFAAAEPAKRSAGRECCRAEASLDEQLTPRHAPPPRLRALGPDDVRIRVVPAPELVRVSQLIRVLLGIEPEIFEVTHATSPFSSRREAVWLRPTAGMRWIGTKGRRVSGPHAPRPTWPAPFHPVIAHASRSLPKAVEPDPREPGRPMAARRANRVFRARAAAQRPICDLHAFIDSSPGRVNTRDTDRLGPLRNTSDHSRRRAPPRCRSCPELLSPTLSPAVG